MEIPADVKACVKADDAPGLRREVELGRLDVDALYPGSGGRALLHYACLQGAPSCCRALLDLDASPNIQVLTSLPPPRASARARPPGP